MKRMRSPQRSVSLAQVSSRKQDAALKQGLLETVFRRRRSGRAVVIHPTPPQMLAETVFFWSGFTPMVQYTRQNSYVNLFSLSL